MALPMARAWKHPSTGVYYFRKAVPDDLRDILGVRESKQSLRTKDPAEARLKHTEVAARVEREWAELRARAAAPVLAALDHATIKAMGAAYEAFLLEEDEDRRLDGFMVPAIQPETPTPSFDDYADTQAGFEADARHLWARGQSDVFFESEVDLVLDWPEFRTLKLAPSSPSRRLIARELQAAVIRAGKAKRQRNDGEPVETPAYPPVAPKVDSEPLRSPCGLLTLFADWWKEAQATGIKKSTHDNYSNTVRKLVAFLEHDDAAKLTPDDVIRFKDHRLSEVSPKTVNDGDLAALKTILGWGKTNRRLTINAAEGITIKLRKKPRRVRPNGFTDDEARALLAAADAYKQKPRERTKLYWSKRWLPWLCCYTGARVGELIQLRKQDLRMEDGHYVIRITPEAGTQKVDHYRDVVLHPHLVEKGFAAFVADAKDGYLFIDPPAHGDIVKTLKSRRNDAAEFARATVKDPHVAPSHGWRHRFTTLWHEASLSDRILHDIQGHSDEEGGPVSRKYGETTLKAQARALAKFPRQGGKTE